MRIAGLRRFARIPRTLRNPPFFVHPFFLFFPVRPTLPRAIFFPKIPSFWHLRSTLSRREKATGRGWVLGTVLDGVAPQEKKENPFFLAREKRWGNSAIIIARGFSANRFARIDSRESPRFALRISGHLSSEVVKHSGRKGLPH